MTTREQTTWEQLINRAEQSGDSVRFSADAIRAIAEAFRKAKTPEEQAVIEAATLWQKAGGGNWSEAGGNELWVAVVAYEKSIEPTPEQKFRRALERRGITHYENNKAFNAAKEAGLL